MVEGDLIIEPSPPGFLNREQFENDVTHVIRRIMRDNPQSLEEHDSRQEVAETVLCELLAIDKESNLADIEYLAEHMSEDKSGVIRSIMNRNHSPEAVARMDSLYEAVREFEETHRDQNIVPRAVKEEPPEA